MTLEGMETLMIQCPVLSRTARFPLHLRLRSVLTVDRSRGCQPAKPICRGLVAIFFTLQGRVLSQTARCFDLPRETIETHAVGDGTPIMRRHCARRLNSVGCPRGRSGSFLMITRSDGSVSLVSRMEAVGLKPESDIKADAPSVFANMHGLAPGVSAVTQPAPTTPASVQRKHLRGSSYPSVCQKFAVDTALCRTQAGRIKRRFGKDIFRGDSNVAGDQIPG